MQKIEKLPAKERLEILKARRVNLCRGAGDHPGNMRERAIYSCDDAIADAMKDKKADA